MRRRRDVDDTMVPRVASEHGPAKNRRTVAAWLTKYRPPTSVESEAEEATTKVGVVGDSYLLFLGVQGSQWVEVANYHDQWLVTKKVKELMLGEHGKVLASCGCPDAAPKLGT